MDPKPNRSKSSWLPALWMVAALMLITWATFQSLEGNRSHREAQTVIGSINQQEISYLQFQNEIRFQALRLAMRQQADVPINQAAVLNRLVTDVLLLQAADEAGIEVSDQAVQAAIDSVIESYELSPQEFEAILAEQDVAYVDFEESIRNYLTILLFAEVEILDGVASANRQAALQSWVGERYDASDTEFNPDFLDFVIESQLP